MSNIPSTAIAAAFIPVTQSTNEMIRARKAQSIKEYHHHEEVEELDDTAVNSVTDEQEGKEQRDRKGRKRADGENVDIESLKEGVPPPTPAPSDSLSHLDISA